MAALAFPLQQDSVTRLIDQDAAGRQGFAVRIKHADLMGEGLPEAVLKVLNGPQYAAAAKGASVKLRARKRGCGGYFSDAVKILTTGTFSPVVTVLRERLSSLHSHEVGWWALQGKMAFPNHL